MGLIAAFASASGCTTGGSSAARRVAAPTSQAANSGSSAPECSFGTCPDPRDVALVAAMTLQEKANQLTQYGSGPATGPDDGGRPKNKSLDDFIREGIGSILWNDKGAREANRLQRIALEQSRLKIPLLFSFDIIHGYWTTFPVPLAIASSWNPANAHTMARVSGLEGYSGGQRWTFAPMLDQPIDPRWGRVFETFGEAPRLSGDFGVATIKGFHGALHGRPDLTPPGELDIATCAKHLVGYGASKAGKDYAYVDLSMRALREFHLPPFEAAIKAGVSTIMPAFTTATGGVPMTVNHHILVDVVRQELGFEGVYVSDYGAITELTDHGVAADDMQATVMALRDGTISIDMQDSLIICILPRQYARARSVSSRLIARFYGCLHSSGNLVCGSILMFRKISKAMCACRLSIATRLGRWPANLWC
ncbi:MAG: glycoside hydrolase family 3 N-terminal domain-containing protein [Myxococcota bacterium]